MFCLPKFESEKMLTALRGGKIVPEKLIDMSSQERRTYFESIVGKENAPEVNALFEQKLLLKDQKRGLVSWAKQITGIKEATKKDILSTIERMDRVLTPENERAFLNDLAAKKLGTEVTFEEATSIAELAKEAGELKTTLTKDMPDRSPERIEYGVRAAKLQNLIEALKVRDETFLGTLKDKPISTIAGAVKSVRATADISFTLRQGWKILATHPVVWMKAFLKQWSAIGRALKGEADPLLFIKADILSRENAINGKYQIGKADLGVVIEEPFPVDIPGRIPVLGRLFKAAEAAYKGAALRSRADLMDIYVRKAEEFGLNTLNPKEAAGAGLLSNALTGRGHVDLASKGPFSASNINVAFFSIRFWKSNYDMLTMHSLGFGVPKSGSTIKTLGITQDRGRAFVRKEAAINLSKVILTTSATLWLAKQLGFDVDLRPNSTKFGQVCKDNICYDVSGGMRGLVTLASRIITGEYISAKGKKTNLYDAKFGQMDGIDLVLQHGLGKLSPSAGLLASFLRGNKDFAGKPLTTQKVIISQTTPIAFETYLGLKEEEAGTLLGAMIAEGLGIGVTKYK